MEKAQVTQVFNSLTTSIENNEKPFQLFVFGCLQLSRAKWTVKNC